MIFFMTLVPSRKSVFLGAAENSRNYSGLFLILYQLQKQISVVDETEADEIEKGKTYQQIMN